MPRFLKTSLLIFFFGTFFLASCNSKEATLIDGDKHITDEMNDVISDYIVEKYSANNTQIEKHVEVHRIYGTSESDGVVSVYMWSYYNGFNRSTGLEEQTGHSLPAVIRLSKENGSYTVLDYEEPLDGSYYKSSLEKMFPKKYLKKVLQDAGKLGDLQKEMDKIAKEWLESGE